MPICNRYFEILFLKEIDKTSKRFYLFFKVRNILKFLNVRFLNHRKANAGNVSSSPFH
jgi:hypothetical protein